MRTDCLESGRKALAVGDWELARAELTQAVEEAPTAEALEELAWANWWLSDIPRVTDLRTRAYHAYLDRKDARGASRNASWLGLDCMEFSGEFAVANGWFQRAESLLEGIEPCSELCMIRTLKANLVFRVEKNPDKALAILDETINLCKSIDDSEALMVAEGLKGTMLVNIGRVREGMGLLDEATVMALQEQSAPIHSVTTTCCFLIDACQRVRDYERAGQWCNKVKELCKRWNHRAVFATCRVQYAAVLIWRGEWKEAEAELNTALDELEKYKPAGISACLLRLADLRRRQGRWTETTALLNKVGGHWLKTLIGAELACDQGEFQTAYEFLDKFLRQMPRHEKTERVAGLEVFIRSCLALGRKEEATSAFNELKDIASAVETMPMQAAYRYASGLIQLASGLNDQAQKDFVDAIDAFEQLLSPYEAARSRMTLATTLLASNKAEAGHSEVNRAISIFKALGAQRDLEKAKELIRKQPKEDIKGYGFTRRELAVLRLVASGKNNDEISDTLSLSVRTVEKHLSNIYQKLGTTGKSARAFAVSYAARHHLI